jgi:hypothetical protein
MTRPYFPDDKTDDEIITEALQAQAFRMISDLTAASQKSFRFPSGREMSKQEIETGFRRYERLLRMIAERTVHKDTDAVAKSLSSTLQARLRRLEQNKDFYLECFLAETGCHPSECILIYRQDGSSTFCRVDKSTGNTLDA